MTTSIEDVIDLTQRIRKNIRSLASRRRIGMELLSLGRFVGKVEGLVEALYESVHLGTMDGLTSWQREDSSDDVSSSHGCMSPAPLLQSTSSASQMLASPSVDDVRPTADLDDIMEAVENVKEVVSFIERQGSVERLLLLEENRELLKVTASDLGYSITTFEPLLQWLPNDISDDYWNLQKQLKELGFFADPDAVLSIQDTLNGLVLFFCGYMSGDSVRELLSKTLVMILHEEKPMWQKDQEIMEQNGITWMMENISSLYQAALMQKASGDYSVYFQYLLMAKGITMLFWDCMYSSSDAGKELCGQHVMKGWSCPPEEKGVSQTQLEREICLEHMCGELMAKRIQSSDFLMNLQQIEGALDQITENAGCIFDMVGRDSAQAWTVQTAKDVSNYISSTLLENDGTSHHSEDRAICILILAAMIEHQAEMCPDALVESRMPDKVLQCVEVSPTPTTRAALLATCKTLFRNKACRKTLHDHRFGLLILLRFLTSPVALVKRNAARALSNYCIQDEHLKILAHRMGATQSLLALLGRSDVLGQEAAASTIANLAANCPSVQAEIGNSGNPFVTLIQLIKMHADKPMKRSSYVLSHAARAIQNLTGRINLNRLKAVDAGAIPLLEKLLHFDGIEPRSSAAVALFNLTRCSFAQDVEISSSGISALLGILASSDTPYLAKTSALLAAKHAVSRLQMNNNIQSLAAIELRDERLGALVAFLDDPRKDIQSAAAAIVGTLCQCRTARVPKCFVRKGALNPLISMLQSKETSSSAKYALGAISSTDEEMHGIIEKSMSAAEAASSVGIPGTTSEVFQRSSSNPAVIETC